MKTKMNVVAVSHEDDHIDQGELRTLAGKYAGTCYAEDGYETIKHQPIVKAQKRAAGNARRGHHSVFQHSVISFEVVCSKMICIILNSMGVSNASEKSARYTFMTPEQPEVDRIYQKWYKRFRMLIINYVGAGFFTEGELEKMALDQARYMLSIFTPTSMVYSIPYRNICYLVDWMGQMVDNLAGMQDTWFHRELRQELISTIEAFRGAMGEELPFHDNKNEYLHVLPYQATGEFMHIDHEILSDVYQVERKASLACFAHLIRHRTTTNWINFNGHPGQWGFYEPPLLETPENRGCGFEKEWLADINSIAEYCPQGTLVSFVQQGSFDKLIQVTKERLCGRALLETQNVVAGILGSFKPENLSSFNRKLLLDHLDADGHVCARCKFKDFHCTDGCKWGGDKALTRLI